MGENIQANGATIVFNFEDIAFFRIPIAWIVGTEPDGSIVIYEKREGSGTLRPWTEEYIFGDIVGADPIGAIHNGVPYESLGEGVTLSYNIFDVEEDGEPLCLHQWLVVIQKAEGRLRLVTFTHTIEAENKCTADTDWELTVVNLAVRGALYPEAASSD